MKKDLNLADSHGNAFCQAIAWRKNLLRNFSHPVRIFHGPAEGTQESGQIALDLFVDEKGRSHIWMTYWESQVYRGLSEELEEELEEFFKEMDFDSAVILSRPQKGKAPVSKLLWGEPIEEGFWVQENSLRFRIRMNGEGHPGLFLDHLPLRNWLIARNLGKRILNLFCYTGSLSVAAALRSKAEVYQVDLSKRSLDWAQQNWVGNGLAKEKLKNYPGDAFDWLDRYRKKNEMFDCVIVDPPSYSRSKHGEFSTKKDLVRLHEAILQVMNPGGILVTSINSANLDWSFYELQIRKASQLTGRSLQLLDRAEQPETFPTQLGEVWGSRYLKGMIFRVL